MLSWGHCKGCDTAHATPAASCTARALLGEDMKVSAPVRGQDAAPATRPHDSLPEGRVSCGGL